MEPREPFMTESAVEAEKKPAKVLKGMPEFLEMREGKEQMETDKFPQYLMMNLETGCPFSCKKCAQPGRNREMGQPLSLDERKNILDMSAGIGVKELVIIGAGEPTTPKNFKDIVSPLFEAAHEKGMGTIMFTTAFGIDKEQAEFFRDNDVTIFVSLDSLDSETYKKLTGTGNLARVLENIQILRDAYKETQEVLPDGRKLVRLAINVTIQKDNVDELDKIKEFAGDDMQFIANVPMLEGKLRIYRSWAELVGNGNLETFKRLAAEKSETGSHSSVAEGTCSYFNRGISIDSDGQFLTCGYASDSAHYLGNVREGVSPESLLEHYQEMRKKYVAWCEKIGRKPSCPLRDDDYKNYIHSLKDEGRESES
jgi:cyclic pyranopterin phosphate synthase